MNMQFRYRECVESERQHN